MEPGPPADWTTRVYAALAGRAIPPEVCPPILYQADLNKGLLAEIAMFGEVRGCAGCDRLRVCTVAWLMLSRARMAFTCAECTVEYRASLTRHPA